MFGRSKKANRRASRELSHASQHVGSSPGTSVAPRALPDNALQKGPADREYSVLETVDGDGMVLIGKGTTIYGEIGECAHIEVQGRVEGSLIAEVVVVREGGSLSGTLMATRAEIRGVVDGVVNVEELLDVKSTGNVHGDLCYGRISIAIGGDISGNVQKLLPPQPPEPDETYSPFTEAGTAP